MTSISVIIPVRNESEHVPKLLELHRTIATNVSHQATQSDHDLPSTQGQGPQPPDYGFDELIVVDGGSTDGCVAALTDAGVRVLSTAPGRARQMNAGAANASGDILLFLHADTQLPADAAVAIRQALTSGCVWGRFDVKIIGRSRWLRVIAAGMNLRSRWSGVATGDQGIFVARDTFTTIGGYADVPLLEDIKLCKSLLGFSRPACLRGKVHTSGRRWDESGPLRVIVLMWLLRFGHWRGVKPENLAPLYRRDFSLRQTVKVCFRS